MTNYPRDEFDRVPEFSNRSGSHRANGWAAAAAVGGVRPGLRWLMVFGVVALLVGVFSFTALPKLMGDGNGKTPAPVAGTSNVPSTPTATESSSTEPVGESSTGTPETPGESTAPSESEDPFASQNPSGTPTAPSESESGLSGEVDFTAPIGVFNGAKKAGIAGTASATLQSAGFTNVSAANWSKNVTYSTVYYTGETYRASAEKAAAELGITSIMKSQKIPGKIAVVLGSNWR